MQPLSSGGAVAFAQAKERLSGPYLRRLARSTVIQPSDEIRAMWVVRDALKTPDDIDRCIDFAARTRFHILFVQVRGRGDAYYNSTLDPPATELTFPIQDFDPLAYLLVRAHAAGISIHAWLNVFYVWSQNGAPPEGHIVRVHPDWLVTDVEGVRMDERTVDTWKTNGIEGYYMSPFSKEARSHMVDVVRELVGLYPVDGVHLDYVRFPGPEFGFGVARRTRFALDWGVDPVELYDDPAGLSAVLGAGAVAALDSIWCEWRVQQVDSTVMSIREAVGEDVALSAAVVADRREARNDKGQDWSGWVHNRWVDFVVPMAYNYRPEELLDWVRILHNTIGRERLLVGLAVHDGRDQYLQRSVNILRTERVTGYSIFSYNVLTEKRFAANFIDEVLLPGEESPQ
jgi:uncharacterized lipoprotein YddW (UPF0748 family)